MINLRLKDYCGNCPEFKVVVEKEEMVDMYGEVAFISTIRCKHRERCERLLEHLRTQKE